MRWSRTASLRATATTARRLPFVRIRRIPQDLICDPAIVRISSALAAAYRVARTSRSPALDIRPGLSCSPDWYRRGVRPKCAATVRYLLKRAGPSMAALNVSAAFGPTPGTVIIRKQVLSLRAACLTRRSRSRNCRYISSRASNSGNMACAKTSSTSISGRTRSSKLPCYTVLGRRSPKIFRRPRTSFARSIVLLSKALRQLSRARVPCASRLFM